MRSILPSLSAYTVVGVLLTFVSSFGQNFFIAVFGGDLRNSFGLSNGQFGGLYTGVTIVSALAFVWAGKLVDRYSLRVVGSATVLALAGAATLLSTSHGIVALALALCGLRLFGQGMATHVSVTAVTRRFGDGTRGKALALAGVGNPLGEAILPLTAVAAMQWFGWRDVWLVIGSVLLVACVPLVSYLLAAERSVPGKPSNDDRPAAGPVRPAPRTDREPWTVSQVLRHPIFYLLLPGLLAPVFINTAVFFHQVALSQAKGWDPAWFVAGYPLSAAANISSALMAGWFMDRFGWHRMLSVVLVPFVMALVVLAGTDTPAIIPLYLSVAGATMGAIAVLQGVILVDLYGTRYFGAVRAIVTACTVFLGAVGPGAVGWMLDRHVGFEVQLAGMALYVVVGICLFLAARLFFMASAGSDDRRGSSQVVQ